MSDTTDTRPVTMDHCEKRTQEIVKCVKARVSWKTFSIVVVIACAVIGAVFMRTEGSSVMAEKVKTMDSRQAEDRKKLEVVHDTVLWLKAKANGDKPE